MHNSSNKTNISKARSEFYRNCRIPYEAQAIRESNSFGPISQKYDEFIELWDKDMDLDLDRSGRRKSYVQQKLTKMKKKDLETIPDELLYDRKASCRPIIHCYTDINNTVTSKKTPIKKISFALPDEKVLKCMDWTDYHGLEVIHKFMDDLELEFPSICTTGSIGQSVEGRSLKILKVSNSNASNVAVWMDAGIHAREWIAPAVNTYIADHISRNFGNLPESVTNKDWYFLPVVNPDGYHYSHTTDRLWRKNRAFHLGQRCGVDLNRNFSYGFGGRGSSNEPTNAFYKGPHPFSEPESSAMRDLFLNSGINFKVYITLHSYGQIIIFPYACTTAMAPDYVRLLEGATAMSKAIYKTNGEIYKVGISRDVMYGAAGTSNDFAHGRAGIPFCYLIELRSKKHKFKLPKEQIEDTGNEILSSVKALMEFVDTCTDESIDYYLDKNESFVKGNTGYVNVTNSHIRKSESYNKRDYDYGEKSNNRVSKQGSFIRWPKVSGERVITLETPCDAECETQWVRSYDNGNETMEHKDMNTLEKETDPYKEIVDYFNDTKKNLSSRIHTETQNMDESEAYVNKTYGSSYIQTESSVNQTTDPYIYENNSFIIQTDSSRNQAESTETTSASVDQSGSFAESDDSYEAWNYFFRQKNNFHEMRSHLLQNTAESYDEADMQCTVAGSSSKVAPTQSNPNPKKSQVWEVKFPQEGQRQFVKTLDTFKAIHIWKEERSTMEIMVEGSRAAQVAGILHERDIPYTIAIEDLTPLIEKEQSTSAGINWSHSSKKKTKAMDWQNYHTLDTIYTFMDSLQAELPHLCSVHVIGKSVEGRDLKMLKISNGGTTNEGVWMDGAIHPREWISPAVVTYLANQIARTFNELPEYVTNKDWYILPVLNPDGYEYTHTHDRMWRKNRARYGECIGVDLNRNFSFGFGEKGEEGSSDDPGNVFYRGPKAFSEPETAAVRRAITNSPTTFKVFLSFHSYGEVVIFPWGYTSDACPDYVELLEGGTAMAKAIYRTNGHTYKVGSTKDLMYYAAGTSTDWSYAVANIPYSYMVELRSKQHRFLLPKEEIISTAKEIQNGVFRLLAFVDQRCTGTQTCACPK